MTAIMVIIPIITFINISESNDILISVLTIIFSIFNIAIFKRCQLPEIKTYLFAIYILFMPSLLIRYWLFPVTQEFIYASYCLFSGHILLMLSYTLTERVIRKKRLQESTLLKRAKFHKNFIIFILILVFAFIVRDVTLVGVVDVEPNIPFSGIIYYILVNGIFLIVMMTSASAVSSGRIFLGFLIALTYGIYQASFGWRIGLFDAVTIIVILVCSQKLQSSTLKILIMFGCALIALNLVVALEDAVREGAQKSIIHSFLRMDYFGFLITSFEIGMPLHIFDSDNFSRILNGETTASKIHNQELMGEFRKNGLANSGFGGMYVTGGIIFVLIFCVCLGVATSIIKHVLKIILKVRGSELSIENATLALTSFFILKRYTIHSFSMGALKEVFAMIVLVSILILSRRVKF